MLGCLTAQLSRLSRKPRIFRQEWVNLNKSEFCPIEICAKAQLTGLRCERGSPNLRYDYRTYMARCERRYNLRTYHFLLMQHGFTSTLAILGELGL